MKITKRQLQEIVKEERAKLVKEQAGRPPVEFYDLEREINDFIIVIDRFFMSAKVQEYLEPTGLLDNPDSWAIGLEDLRYDLGELVKEMMGGKRRIR